MRQPDHLALNRERIILASENEEGFYSDFLILSNVKNTNMDKTGLFIFCMLARLCGVHAQEAVDVTDQTLKIGGMKEEILYFGFAEGDNIIFNFDEIDKKELKEVEIAEYPDNSRFSDYKTKKIQDKSIAVSRTGVYVFRFKNSAISGRICRIRIQRIPAGEHTKNFNSMVSWKTRQDTSWNTYTKEVIAGYDTVYLQKTRRELISIDTTLTPLCDKSIRVHSETAIGKQQTSYATIQLPQNTYFPHALLPYKSTEVLAWSYWLGVGQKAAADYEKANKALISGIKIIGTLSGYGALAALASTGVSFFTATTLGDNVRYQFKAQQNGQFQTIDYGNVVSASGRNDRIRQGQVLIELYNDNFKDGIDVNLKVIVLQVNKTWDDVPYTQQKVSARLEKQLFRDPVIKTYHVPVTGS
jgi:hypothetical protein